MERPYASFYLMEHHSQVQARHAGGEQRFLHVPVIVLDFGYIALELLLHSLSIKLASQCLYRSLDLRSHGIVWLFGQLSNALFVELPFRLEGSQGTEDYAAQLKAGLVFYETLPIGLLDEAGGLSQGQVYRSQNGYCG